jgi:hypothetical protein
VGKNLPVYQIKTTPLEYMGYDFGKNKSKANSKNEGIDNSKD